MNQKNSQDVLSNTKNSQQGKDDKYEVLKNKIKYYLLRSRENPNFQDLSIYNVNSLEGYSQQYKSEQMQDSILKISQENKAWLGIRGDGNCFYRSIIILYLLELFKSNDFKEVDKFIERVKNMKNITINNVYEPDAETLQYILVCFLYQLKNIREQQINMTMGDVIEQYNSRPEVDLSAIVICRNLIFQTFQMFKNHPSFCFFVEEQMQSLIPKMLLQYYEYAEDVIIPLASQTFRCNLLVQNLYRQSQTSINTEKLLYQPFDQRFPIFTTLNVLFTKGHYESLISNNQMNSFEQFYKIKKENLIRRWNNYQNYEFYYEIINQLKIQEEIQLKKKVEAHVQESTQLNPNDIAQQTKQIQINNFIEAGEEQNSSLSSKEKTLQQKMSEEQYKKQEFSNELMQKQYSQRQLQRSQLQQEKQQNQNLAQTNGLLEQGQKEKLTEIQEKNKLQDEQNNQEENEIPNEEGTRTVYRNSMKIFPRQKQYKQIQSMNQNFMESSSQRSLEQISLPNVQEQNSTSKDQINTQQNQNTNSGKEIIQKQESFQSELTKKQALSQNSLPNQINQKQNQLIQQVNYQQKQFTYEEGKNIQTKEFFQQDQAVEQNFVGQLPHQTSQPTQIIQRQNLSQQQKNNENKNQINDSIHNITCVNFQLCKNFVDKTKTLEIVRKKGQRNGGFLCQSCLEQNTTNFQERQEEKFNRDVQQSSEIKKNQQFQIENTNKIQQKQEEIKQDQQNKFSQSKIKKQESDISKESQLQDDQFDDNRTQIQKQNLNSNNQRNMIKFSKKHLPCQQEMLKNQLEDKKENNLDLIGKNKQDNQNQQSTYNNAKQNNNQTDLNLCASCKENKERYIIHTQNYDKNRWICINCIKEFAKYNYIKNDSIYIKGEKYMLSEALQQDIYQICPQLINQAQQSNESLINPIGLPTQSSKEYKILASNQCQECKQIYKTFYQTYEIKFMFANDKTKKEYNGILCQNCLLLLITKDQYDKNIIESNDDSNKQYIIAQEIKKKIEWWQSYSLEQYSKNKGANQNQKDRNEEEKGEEEEEKEEEKINEISSNSKYPKNKYDYKIDQPYQSQKQLSDQNPVSNYQEKNIIFSKDQLINDFQLNPHQSKQNLINNNFTSDEHKQKKSVQNLLTQEIRQCESCLNSLEEEKLEYYTDVLKDDITQNAIICSECFQQMLFQNENLQEDSIITFKQKQYKINIKTFKIQKLLIEGHSENQVNNFNKQFNQKNEQNQVNFLSSNDQKKNKETQNSQTQIQKICENCGTFVDQDTNKFDIIVRKNFKNEFTAICSKCFLKLSHENPLIKTNQNINFEQKNYYINFELFNKQKIKLKADRETTITTKANQIGKKILEDKEKQKQYSQKQTNQLIQKLCESCYAFVDQETNKYIIQVRKIYKFENTILCPECFSNLVKNNPIIYENKLIYFKRKEYYINYLDFIEQKRKIENQILEQKIQEYKEKQEQQIQKQTFYSNYQQNQNKQIQNNSINQIINKPVTSPKNPNHNLQRKNYFEQQLNNQDYQEKTQSNKREAEANLNVKMNQINSQKEQYSQQNQQRFLSQIKTTNFQQNQVHAKSNQNTQNNKQSFENQQPTNNTTKRPLSSYKIQKQNDNQKERNYNDYFCFFRK